MTPADEARARHRLYALLGELLFRGPVPDALALAQQLPALALSGEPEALWVSHHAAMTAAWPWESAWFSEEGQRGGEGADRVRSAYAEGGFFLAPQAEPDHVGLELAYLGHLCAAEAEALTDGQDAEPLRALARTFLERHLGRWFDPWALALRDGGEGAWVSVVELAQELVSSHALALGAHIVWELPGSLPDAGELKLWGVVQVLTRPACSGWLPTPAALERLGDAAGVPTGVTDRAGRLELVFRSAGIARTVPQLILALQGELSRWAAALPGTPWAHRALQTREWLVR